jgi:hypothetical protein
VGLGPAGTKLWGLWAGWTRGGLAWRECCGSSDRVTVGMFSGGGPATSSHPSAHGSGGLPHQLPEDYLLYR